MVVRSNQPFRNVRNGCGAPVFEIPRSALECYLEQNLKIEEISKILSVSESTIYRRMRQYGLSKMEFSDVAEARVHSRIPCSKSRRSSAGD